MARSAAARVESPGEQIAFDVDVLRLRDLGLRACRSGDSVAEMPRCVSIVRCASGVIRMTEVAVVAPVPPGTGTVDPDLAQIVHVELPEIVVGRLAGVGRLAAEIGDADDRVAGRSAGAAVRGPAGERRQHLHLLLGLDQRHQPFGDVDMVQKRIVDLQLDVDNRVADAEDVISHPVCVLS